MNYEIMNITICFNNGGAIKFFLPFYPLVWWSVVTSLLQAFEVPHLRGLLGYKENVSGTKPGLALNQ